MIVLSGRDLDEPSVTNKHKCKKKTRKKRERKRKKEYKKGQRAYRQRTVGSCDV